METPVRVMISVTTDDPETLTKTIEHFSRVMAGLAMDGVKSWMHTDQDDEENEDG